MKKKIKNFLSLSLSKIPDKPYCILTFLLKHRRLPNLSSPKYFNDKLLSLKLSIRDPKYKIMVDKYSVRDYIKNTIGEEYLIPLIGVYSDPSEVDFESLPDKFALKLTNGSQNNIICTDKSKLDWKKASKDIRYWLKIDPYKRTREWQYKDLPNRFVIEQLISDSNGELIDYKFWCFHGKPEYLQVDTDRFFDHKRNFYKADTFEDIDDLIVGYPRSDLKIQKPINYEKMLEIASVLSKDLPFARIDLYNVNGKIYFGEITFYPGNCNRKMPIKYEKIFGDKLII